MHRAPPAADRGSTVIPMLLAGILLAIIAVPVIRSSRQRSRMARMQGRAKDARTRPIGSSLEIADGGQLGSDELLEALRVAQSTKLDDDDNLDFGAPLGLTVMEGTSHAGGAGQPQVMHGSRHGHQAFVRQGMVGNAISPGLGRRKYREMTVIRVLAPAFEWEARNGRLEASDDAPAAASELFARISASPDIWRDLRGVAGPEGIGVSRGAADAAVAGWVYDLWLLERLAHELGLPALERVRLRRDWRLPYGLTDWKPPIRDLAR